MTPMTGKNKCEILRNIRRKIAEENGIVYFEAECTYVGDCRGICPKCDAEIKYLDDKLGELISQGIEPNIPNINVGIVSELSSFEDYPENLRELLMPKEHAPVFAGGLSSSYMHIPKGLDNELPFA